MKRLLPLGIWDNPTLDEIEAYNEFVATYLAGERHLRRYSVAALPPGIWDNPTPDELDVYKEFVLAYVSSDEQLRQTYLEMKEGDTFSVRALTYYCTNIAPVNPVVTPVFPDCSYTETGTQSEIVCHGFDNCGGWEMYWINGPQDCDTTCQPGKFPFDPGWGWLTTTL